MSNASIAYKSKTTDDIPHIADQHGSKQEIIQACRGYITCMHTQAGMRGNQQEIASYVIAYRLAFMQKSLLDINTKLDTLNTTMEDIASSLKTIANRSS